MFNQKIEVNNIGLIKKNTFMLKDISVFIGQNNTSKTLLLNSLYYFNTKKFKQKLYGIIKDNINSYPKESPSVLKYINNIIERVFSEVNILNINKLVYKNNSTEVKSYVKFKAPKLCKLNLLEIAYETIISTPILLMYIEKSQKKDTLENVMKKYKNNLNVNDADAEAFTNFIKNILGAKVFSEIIVQEFLAGFFNLTDLDTEMNSYFFPVERAGINRFYTHALVSFASENTSIQSAINFRHILENDTREMKLKETYYYEIADKLERNLFNGNIVSEINQNDQLEINFYDSKNKKYSVNLYSSSINELSTFILYLKYYAKQGDVVYLDEPELSLHPDSQRMLVKYISLLRESGLKFILITHSDYIAKEFNNLITISKIKSEEFLTKSGYVDKMKLNYSQICMYSICRENNKIDNEIEKVSIESAIETDFGYSEKLFEIAINTIQKDSIDIAKSITKESCKGKDLDLNTLISMV